MSIKRICYSSNCDIVLTGFNIEQYYSCKWCKQEVTREINEKWELEVLREKKRQEDKKKKEEEKPQVDYWEFL